MKTYRYIRLGRLFVCLDHSLIKMLGLRDRSQWPSLLKSHGFSRKQQIRWFYWVLLGKFTTCIKGSIALSSCGAVALRAHHGYKVFNFDSQVVSKLFDAKTSIDEVSSETLCIKNASRFTFTPSLLSQGVDYYTEDYLDGELLHLGKGKSLPTEDDSFQQRIMPILLELAADSPRQVLLGDYVKGLEEGDWESRYAGIMSDREVERISSFLAKQRNYLMSQKNRRVTLVSSHGDFSKVNILKLRNGEFRVIDWETLQHRSVFSDLLNYFTTEIYYQRQLNRKESDILKLSAELIAQLKARGIEIESSLVDSYACSLYYIERTHMLLDRVASINIAAVIMRSIDIFDEFEKVHVEQSSLVKK